MYPVYKLRVTAECAQTHSAEDLFLELTSALDPEPTVSKDSRTNRLGGYRNSSLARLTRIPGEHLTRLGRFFQIDLPSRYRMPAVKSAVLNAELISERNSIFKFTFNAHQKMLPVPLLRQELDIGLPESYLRIRS